MNGLHIVISEPPKDVADDEFNAWYEAHLEEILSVPGFSAARRYHIEPVVADGAIPHRYLAIYETDRDPGAAVTELERAGFGSQDSYVELKGRDAGALELPPWFERARFASWNCRAMGARVVQEEDRHGG